MPAVSPPLAPALPAMGLSLLLRALFKRARPAPPSSVPELVTEYRLERLPLADIARYRSAFGFADGPVPLTWWYLCAQRAHLATMLDRRFPFRIAGLVHMENVLEEHGAVPPGQPLLLRTVLRLPPPSAGGALRCVLETIGSADGAPVFTCSSTYLIRRGQRSQGGRAREPEAAVLAALAGAPLAQWTLDPAAGRRYARLSGDWNPIHLYGWSARLLGMRAPIIHGMHTLAAGCAALENTYGRHAVRIACRFRAPVALGTSVALYASADGATFVVHGGDQPAVSGTCTLA